MYLEPTAITALAVGGGYYVLDRLADPTEIVTLVHTTGNRAIVRSLRGIEFPIEPSRLSPVPPDELYRQLRASSRARL
jgi:hypothetical protein